MKGPPVGLTKFPQFRGILKFLEKRGFLKKLKMRFGKCGGVIKGGKKKIPKEKILGLEKKIEIAPKKKKIAPKTKKCFCTEKRRKKNFPKEKNFRDL